MKVDRAVRLGGGRTDIPLALTVSGALCSGSPATLKFTHSLQFGPA
jgi:hypothetical protein